MTVWTVLFSPVRSPLLFGLCMVGVLGVARLLGASWRVLAKWAAVVAVVWVGLLIAFVGFVAWAFRDCQF